MTRGPRAALTVSMSSVGSVPLAGGLVVGMPQARRAETGEWSALTEATEELQERFERISNRGMVDATHVGFAELRYLICFAASITVPVRWVTRGSPAENRDCLEC